MVESLFLDAGEKLLGVIKKAEISISKANGHKYINLDVKAENGDIYKCYVSCIDYTTFVIAEDLSRDERDEEANVSQMMGRLVELKVQEPRVLEGIGQYDIYIPVVFYRWK